MKVTLNWLRQHVEFGWSPEELAERLTMLGLEVEGVQKLAGEFEGVVVAEVLTREKHPNADKLSLCRVHDGKGERQIVCGAQNFKAGDKVPLILPGAALPPRPGETQPFTIKVGKIRGVESQGMMCAAEELGIDPLAIGHAKEDGLLILRPDAVVGQSLAEYLGRPGADVVYDLEVTPNRPDLNSVIGIAREIAAVTGRPLLFPDATVMWGTTDPLPVVAGVRVEELVAVRVEARDLCARYTARVVQGVKVGPSPAWLRQWLEKVGLRSINNVVDVTNFVMLETGQPLHAFDFRLISKGASGQPTLVIRRAVDGEEFVTLDSQKRTLTPEMLLIADEARGIALAGVMGGENTGIQETTTDVLIESAWFLPSNVRRTSKELGLRTDASYRFERGADVGICAEAGLRCAQLILATAGGRLVEGILDAYPEPVVPKTITLRHAKVNALLGLSLRPEEVECHLGQLCLWPATRKARPVDDPSPVESVAYRIPSFRVDLKREIDLIEEVARLHGVDRIPATVPRGVVGGNAFDSVYDQLATVRRLLAGLGLDEAQGQTLIPSAAARLAAAEESVVMLANPLSSDMDALRPSLLPGLLDSLRHNLRHRNEDVALFEVGRVFSRVGGQGREERRVAVALTGMRAPGFWSGPDREARQDISDVKGVVEELLEQMGLRGVGWQRRPGPTGLFLESAAVCLGGKLVLGEVGQLLPALGRAYDLRHPVFLAELRLDELLARRNATHSFKALPQFPAVRRDLALVVPESTTHEQVLGLVRQAKPANLEAVELFDVFRGRNVPEGQKSVAYAFTYRGADRTLTDAEVNASQEKVVAALTSGLNAAVR